MSVTVSISGNTSPTITATTGDTIDVTVSPAGAQGPQGVQGSAGPANTLSIGTVTSGTAAATITGTSPSQVLNLVLPVGSTGATGSKGDTGSQGPAGPANTLSIGTVTSGTAAATITGTAPNQTLNLVLQPGATGATGATGPQGPAGTVNLADETPQPLGTASAGTALSAARADHVHAQGSIAYSGLTGIPSTFAPSAHSHAVSDVTGLQSALDAKQAAGTYATLVSGTVPSSQLPSYVDDVIEYANLAAFTEQSAGKIYVARDTGKIYRWSGSAYVEISPSPGSTDSVTEGSTNLYFTNARAAAAAPVQSVAGRTGTIALTKSDVGLGSVDNTADASKPVSTAQAAADTAVQSFAIQRANHTGTQAISTVTGLQSALDGKQTSGSYASSSHTHSLSDLSQSSATTGQVPTWNGSAWAAATPSGGGGGSANIVEATTAAGFPATGAAQTLYHATNVRRIYFWDASGVYVEAGTSGGGGGSGSLTIPYGGDPFFANVSLLLQFNGSGSTMVDSSGTPKAITANGNATQSATQSKWGGKSLYLDGTGDYVTAASMPSIGTNDFAVEMNVYLTSTSAQYSGLYDQRDANDTVAPVVYLLYDTLYYYVHASNRITGPALSTNRWYHIAVARCDGTTRMYVNGSQVGSSFSDSTNYTGRATAFIGSLYNTFTTNVYIDDVRVTVGSARNYIGDSIAVPAAPLPTAVDLTLPVTFS